MVHVLMKMNKTIIFSAVFILLTSGTVYLWFPVHYLEGSIRYSMVGLISYLNYLISSFLCKRSMHIPCWVLTYGRQFLIQRLILFFVSLILLLIIVFSETGS